jgi:hypothetical protein
MGLSNGFLLLHPSGIGYTLKREEPRAAESSSHNPMTGGALSLPVKPCFHNYEDDAANERIVSKSEPESTLEESEPTTATIQRIGAQGSKM